MVEAEVGGETSQFTRPLALFRLASSHSSTPINFPHAPRSPPKHFRKLAVSTLLPSLSTFHGILSSIKQAPPGTCSLRAHSRVATVSPGVISFHEWQTPKVLRIRVSTIDNVHTPIGAFDSAENFEQPQHVRAAVDAQVIFSSRLLLGTGSDWPSFLH